jgi:ATP-dependent DNA helicase PIF1
MLAKNMSTTSGLVNGTRGVVVRFTRGMSLPVVRLTDGREVIITMQTFTTGSWVRGSGGTSVRLQRRQMPLVLAWAISIHKAQGDSGWLHGRARGALTY